MRLLPGAFGVVLLLVLLTWLLLLAFDDLALAEASLHRDVLQARAGLLGDYDAIDMALDAIDDAVARLRSYARKESLDTVPTDRLAAAVAKDEELTERFKTSNALLQNSLSYVGLLSTSPAFAAQDAQLAPATGALAAAILQLTRGSSPESVAALQQRIERFAAQTLANGPDMEPAQALLSHARLLHDLLPAVDATLKALVAMASRQPLEETRVLFSDHQAAVEATAQRYRLLLYAASLVLLLVLVRLGLQLRARALARRRRAAFEHVIAENSTRLINCPPAEIAARLEQALGEICGAVSAERAYIVVAENPTRVHTWSSDGAAYPGDWPEQALTLSTRLGQVGSGIITVPDVAALPKGEAREILEAAGVRAWACVPLVRPGRVQGIMGLDASRPARNIVFPLSVVRLAGDAVANALEREFLERDRSRLASRLERARRMQTIGTLASGVAHNFNNIIGAILGYAEMVEPALPPGTRPARYITEIRSAAERGRDLVERVLTFGRRREARVRPVQVRALFEEAGSLLHASLPSGMELAIEDVSAGVVVFGESAQLQQVIVNLCTNAAQAMPNGGPISVTAELKEVAAPLSLSHGELTPGRYVCLAVSDTGCGFEEGVARRLFEPFFTTRAAGTGLGLATVQEIVRDHDGAINVDSKLGQGSRFEAWLPAADGWEAPKATTLPLGRGETVLVIESIQERLRRDEEMLAALGYEPVGFERPEDAFAACRWRPDRFDAILVDHAPHIQSGIALAQRLHEIAPRLPVLLATASTTDVGVDTLAEAGISEVLRRPLESAELAAAMTRCLRQTRSLQM
jgi:signal transduction histidine kinase/CheY-like chemotaxis protein